MWVFEKRSSGRLLLLGFTVPTFLPQNTLDTMNLHYSDTPAFVLDGCALSGSWPYWKTLKELRNVKKGCTSGETLGRSFFAVVHSFFLCVISPFVAAEPRNINSNKITQLFFRIIQPFISLKINHCFQACSVVRLFRGLASWWQIRREPVAPTRSIG